MATPGWRSAGKKYSPGGISAWILQKMKQTAEDYLGHEVTEAVIHGCRPTSTTASARHEGAGRIAGLEVKRIINEPPASALAYGSTRKAERDPGLRPGRRHLRHFHPGDG